MGSRADDDAGAALLRGPWPAPETAWTGGGTCPAAEVLAAAAEQGGAALADEALQLHLAGCDRCRRVLSAVALARLDEPAPSLRPLAQEPRRWRLPLSPRALALAASVTLVLGTLAVGAAPLLWSWLGPQPGASAGGRDTEHAPALRPPRSTATPAPRQRLIPPRQAVTAGPRATPLAPALAAPSAPAARPALAPAGTPVVGQVPLRRSPTAAALAAVEELPEPGEELFVEGVVHYQAGRFAAAVAAFDRLLETAPSPTLEGMSRRWRARALAEERGECQPGYVRRVRIDPAQGAPVGAGGQQGATQTIECVLP